MWWLILLMALNPVPIVIDEAPVLLPVDPYEPLISLELRINIKEYDLLVWEGSLL